MCCDGFSIDYDTATDSTASSSRCHTETDSTSGSRPGTPAAHHRALHAPGGAHLPKKNFQRAGLFSSIYKTDE